MSSTVDKPSHKAGVIGNGGNNKNNKESGSTEGSRRKKALVWFGLATLLVGTIVAAVLLTTKEKGEVVLTSNSSSPFLRSTNPTNAPTGNPSTEPTLDKPQEPECVAIGPPIKVGVDYKIVTQSVNITTVIDGVCVAESSTLGEFTTTGAECEALYKARCIELHEPYWCKDDGMICSTADLCTNSSRVIESLARLDVTSVVCSATSIDMFIDKTAGPPEYDVVDTASLTLIIDFSGNYGYSSPVNSYDEMRDLGFTPIADVNLITRRTQSCDKSRGEIDMCSEQLEELLRGGAWWTWPCKLFGSVIDLDWDEDPSGTAETLCNRNGRM